jgi:hypothetical protein
MPDGDSFDNARNDLGARWRLFWLVWLGFLPVAGVGELFLHSRLLVVAWAALFLAVGLRLSLFICPRCERYAFFGWMGSSNVFSQCCRRCQLPLR